MLAETIRIRGYGGDTVHAYLSRPLGAGPYPGVIIIPHVPGWDELNREIARRFSQHGFVALCLNIYERFGHGLPADVAQVAWQSGMVPDQSVMGDCEGALDYLTAQPYSNGRVGAIGMCSGGRHAFMAGCQVPGLSAVVDLWGGWVVLSQEELTSSMPVSPLSLTSQLGCPLMGIFGNEDSTPSPQEVDLHEEELIKHGKDYVFHRYNGAGHSFWNYSTPAYRPTQAIDSWNKVLRFFGEHLKT
jgi:carboxymethylenebutenolidase